MSGEYFSVLAVVACLVAAMALLSRFGLGRQMRRGNTPGLVFVVCAESAVLVAILACCFTGLCSTAAGRLVSLLIPVLWLIPVAMSLDCILDGAVVALRWLLRVKGHGDDADRVPLGVGPRVALWIVVLLWAVAAVFAWTLGAGPS